MELSASRSASGFGFAPLSFRDVIAFQSAYRLRFSPWEIDTLKALDAAWLQYQASQAESKHGRTFDASR